MNTYIKQGQFYEFDFELDGNYLQGTTYEDSVNDMWVKLTESQVAFRAANPTASVKEVFDMALVAVDELAAAKSRKMLEIESADDASNEFFVNGTSMWLKQDLRTTLVSNTIPALEARGKTSTLLWGWNSNGCPVSFDVPITALKQMLPDLEIYAKSTYDLKMLHTSSVNALTSAAEVDALDVTGDYPTKLTFK